MNEIITNSRGEQIGMIKKMGETTYVYDKIGQIAGKCEGGKTYDAIGTIVSHSEIPGLLLKQ